MTLDEIRFFAVETFREWQGDDAMQWGAALAFYGAVSLAPLLVVLLAGVSLFLDPATVQDEVVARMQSWAGEAGAEVAQTVLRQQPLEGGGSAALLALLFLVLGATAVFGQLQTALNRIWDVRVAKGGVKRMVRTRLLGFLMVLGIGLLVVAAVVLNAVLTALGIGGTVGSVLNLGGSVVIFALLFAATYQVLPDVRIAWRDVWVGAAATALLFVLGQFLLGLYLSRSSVGSAYGAAGSLVAFLVWLYYSAQIYFFGAEFTQVWARRHGRGLAPTEGAVRIAPEDDGHEVRGREDGAREGRERKDREPKERAGRSASYP